MTSELARVARQVDELDRRLASLRRETERLRADAAMTRARRQRLFDLLGTDLEGRPLRLPPLVWGVVGGLLALTATFVTYLFGLLSLQHNQPDSDAWVALVCALAAVVSGWLTLIWSKRPGAGAAARTLLRPLTVGLGALSFVALLVICYLRASVLPWS